jgi:hypothetical protein
MFALASGILNHRMVVKNEPEDKGLAKQIRRRTLATACW